MSDLQNRYEKVKASLAGHVTLIAVSKTRTAEAIKDLYDLGHRAFGENKAQEIKDKAPALPDDIAWHFIGHLQSNKVKHVVPYAELIHSIDSLRLLDEVNKRAGLLEKVQDVLLQVHIAEEDAKFGMLGVALEEIIATSLKEHQHIRIRGLMGMATFTEDDSTIEGEFSKLKELFNEMCRSYKSELPDFDILSMGMSGDSAIAIANGSTMVRIGTAIFGKRQY